MVGVRSIVIVVLVIRNKSRIISVSVIRSIGGGGVQLRLVADAVLEVASVLDSSGDVSALIPVVAICSHFLFETCHISFVCCFSRYFIVADMATVGALLLSVVILVLVVRLCIHGWNMLCECLSLTMLTCT